MQLTTTMSSDIKSKIVKSDVITVGTIIVLQWYTYILYDSTYTYNIDF